MCVQNAAKSRCAPTWRPKPSVINPARQKLSGLSERAASVRKCGIPHWPGVNHVRPDFERDVNVSGSGCGCKTNSIVEQCLRRSHLDQRRRKAAKIGEKRRDARILAIDSAADVG